jgi:N-acetyl-anhydromuramyl-L-alanine amidase AmpD
MPDYPGALWVPADPTNYRAAGRPIGAEYDLIVIHCTDGRSRAQPVAEMWQEKNRGSSAHFVIGQDGTVIQCVALTSIAWHAHDANGRSVGIEHCARTPGELGHDDPGLPPSEALYAASARLVAWLLRRVGLDGVGNLRTVVRGHAEADPKTTHTECPLGCGWDWDSYAERLRAELGYK